MHPVQRKIYRRMSPGEKLGIAARLYRDARRLKAAALRNQHPEWNEKEVREKLREVFLHARG